VKEGSEERDKRRREREGRRRRGKAFLWSTSTLGKAPDITELEVPPEAYTGTHTHTHTHTQNTLRRLSSKMKTESNVTNKKHADKFWGRAVIRRIHNVHNHASRT